jgi:protein-disulfide isomerase
MRKVMRIACSVLAMLALGAATFAVPAKGNSSAKQNSAQSQEAQTQSVSGRIATVEKSSFTLAVGAPSTSHSQQMSQTTPKTMTFQIDKNTTVDGKLQVGANADVTYRQDGGNNIAISVRVSQ